MHGNHIHGRDGELDRLRTWLAETATGHGGVVLVDGAPGVGKSRIAEEAARIGHEMGFTCVWGQTWESGSAPSYWPWAQALGGLTVDGAAAANTASLRTLFPGASQPGPSESRFELFVAVSHWLANAGREEPVLIVLEDVHDADAATLHLLEALSSPLRATRVVVLATRRTHRSASTEHAQVHLRLGRQARRIELAPLSDAASRALLREALPDAADTFFDAALAVTGGQPLFLVALRQLARGATTDAEREALISNSVQAVLTRQLEGLAPDTRELLARLSLAGTEFDPTLLAALREQRDVERSIQEACAAGLLVRTTDRAWRFGHAMLRDLLKNLLLPEDRERIHGVWADHLLSASTAEPATLAYHLRRAGVARTGEAVSASLDAAQRAVMRFAFEEAEQHCAYALESGDAEEPAARAHLYQGLALIGLGQADAGRASCLRAADIAQAGGLGELMAEAALAYGSIFRFAAVDRPLVGLLERALGALPEGDSVAKARLLSRLAAARQPDPDPTRPISLAHEAIEMAARTGRPADQMATLRDACSAMVDLVAPEARLPLNRRHLDLALQCDSPTDALRARLRLMTDYAELGDFSESRVHTDAAISLARDGAHPRHRWRAPALQATLALWEGRLADAREYIDAADALGRACGDTNARLCRAIQRSRWCELSGVWDAAPALRAELGGLFGGTRAGERLSAILQARFELHLGRRETALATIEAAGFQPEAELIVKLDRTMWLGLAEWSAAARSARGGEVVLGLLGHQQDTFVSDGVVGLCFRAPTSLVRAYAHAALGHHTEALDCASDAAHKAARIGAMPSAAEAHCEASRFAASVGDTKRAAEHRTSALVIIDEFELAGLRARYHDVFAERPPQQPSAAAAASTGEALLAFEFEAGICAIRWGGEQYRTKTTKGLRALAALVEVPGQEIHVLDLMGNASASGGSVVDRGAGHELLDERAIAAYKARADTLREALAEAETNNDLGRQGPLREELAFLAEELGRATGLSGRIRRAPDAEEKARQAVRKRIRGALGKLDELDESLGKHLRRSVRTGRTCCYDP